MATRNPPHEFPLDRTVPGPRPEPSPPTKFQPPPLACDAHCHVFGPAERFPFSPSRSYTPPDSGVEDFLVLQERLGLSRAVFVQASCHGSDNSAMIDAIRRGEGRFAGVAMIDLSFTDRDLDKLHDHQVRGIRFNFVAHLGGAPDIDVFWELVRRVAGRGWHIVLHFDAKDFAAYAEVLDAMPVPYVIDHMARVPAADGVGQEPFQRLLERIAADERCWVKISCAERLTEGAKRLTERAKRLTERAKRLTERAKRLTEGAKRLTEAKASPFDDVVPFARALIEAAPDRILWGTDWPHPNLAEMPDEGELLDLLAVIAVDETTRNRILVDNPQSLYRFT